MAADSAVDGTLAENWQLGFVRLALGEPTVDAAVSSVVIFLAGRQQRAVPSPAPLGC